MKKQKRSNAMELEKQAEVLNDLVKINNDRIKGYEKAIEQLSDEDADLTPVFLDKIEDSRDYHTQIAAQIAMLGRDIETGTLLAGKIYRTWMDIKTFITGGDRRAILVSCERGEDAAVIAYKTALKSEELTFGQRQLLKEQLSEIEKSHEDIKLLLDVRRETIKIEKTLKKN